MACNFRLCTHVLKVSPHKNIFGSIIYFKQPLLLSLPLNIFEVLSSQRCLYSILIFFLKLFHHQLVTNPHLFLKTVHTVILHNLINVFVVILRFHHEFFLVHESCLVQTIFHYSQIIPFLSLHLLVILLSYIHLLILVFIRLHIIINNFLLVLFFQILFLLL